MAREFKVWCETKDELNDVLTRFGRDGFTWASGHTPTDKLAMSIDAPVGMITFKGHIYFVQSKSDFDDVYTPDMDEISASYYIQNGRVCDVPNGAETVELNRGELLEVLHSLIDSDKAFRDLLASTPSLVTYTGILLAKFESKLFDK